MRSTPMTSTHSRNQSHNGVARRARTATERSAETWKQGAKTITVPVELVSKLPMVDLTWPVKQYFQYVQTAVDLNRVALADARARADQLGVDALPLD